MEERLKSFIEEYSEDFYESIEDIRKYLNTLPMEYPTPLQDRKQWRS